MSRLVFSESIKRLGDLLRNHGLINEQQLEEALTMQKSGVGKRVGEILIEQGHVTEEAVLNVIAEQLGVPYFDLTRWEHDEDQPPRLKEVDARRNRAIVLKETPEETVVGMADPSDPAAKVRLRRLLGRDFRTRLVSLNALQSRLNELYRRTDEIMSLASSLSEELGETKRETITPTDNLAESDAAVAKLVSSIFTDAVRQGASDIHIQPEKDRVLIRQRVDGVLQEQVLPEKRISAALVSRLKLMAGLDIAEKRLPQDGRFSVDVDQKSINCRMSVMPTPFGETIVMRLLNTSSVFLKLSDLGLEPELLEGFRREISRPSGIILVTGPTGSGKSTTLYAALTDINTPDLKIVTVEDPVEYYLQRAVQVQVNAKIGLTFASVLRAVLRQDPDVVMIGEMRDTETMEIGIRAAMTGHLVMSTLHTRSAIGSISRLMDMGAEPYMIAAVVNAVVAQRLARRICVHCAEDSELTEREHVFVEALMPGSTADLPIRRGRGCKRCKDSGYLGRTGLYEFLFLSEDLKSLLRRGDFEGFSAAAQSQGTFTSMLAHGLAAVRNGETTVSELIRIMGEADAEMIASLKASI